MFIWSAYIAHSGVFPSCRYVGMLRMYFSTLLNCCSFSSIPLCLLLLQRTCCSPVVPALILDRSNICLWSSHNSSCQSLHLAQTLMKRNSVYLVFVLGGAIVGERVRPLHNCDGLFDLSMTPLRFLLTSKALRCLITCRNVNVAADCLPLAIELLKRCSAYRGMLVFNHR